MYGHAEGEMWGLAVHPSAERFVTASDDGTVRMWDLVQKVRLKNLFTSTVKMAVFHTV